VSVPLRVSCFAGPSRSLGTALQTSDFVWAGEFCVLGRLQRQKRVGGGNDPCEDGQSAGCLESASISHDPFGVSKVHGSKRVPYKNALLCMLAIFLVKRRNSIETLFC
jgi:hypothetical protein